MGGTASSRTQVPSQERSINYQEESNFFDEQPFRIEGKHLQQALHRSVVALTFLNLHKNIGAGSGVLISKDCILTAAHNIYERDKRSRNSCFKVYIGANGVTEAYHEVGGWRYPPEYETCSVQKKGQFDYALIKLKIPVQQKQFPYLKMACEECLQKNNQTIKLKVAGFPVSYPPDSQGKSLFFKENFKPLDLDGQKIILHQYGLARKGRIKIIDAAQRKICYSISTLPGQSGSPVVVEDKIIAVHVGGDKMQFNIGRIVDASLLNNLQKWTEQLEAAPFLIESANVCQHIKQKMKQQIVLKEKGQKSMDVSEYARLLKLDLKNNEIAAINISHCPRLANVDLSNNKLQLIDLSNNQNLTHLDLRFNQLQALDVGTNIKLTHLNVSFNKLHTIDVTANTNLTELELRNNQLQIMDLKDNTNLIRLSLSQNKLQKIDVRANTKLTHILLSQNKLKKLDLGANSFLTHLYMQNNKLQKLDLRFNVNLNHLNLCNNQLQAMQVSANTNLTYLNLFSNKLQQLDLRNNTNLIYLYLSSNQLQTLDVSANTNLTRLYISSNRITEIDTSQNIKLQKLWLQENRLTRICLFISENVQEEKYFDNQYFNLSNQRSTGCQVLLKYDVEREEIRAKAVRVSSVWRERYQGNKWDIWLWGNDYNNHACAYVFQVI